MPAWFDILSLEPGGSEDDAGIDAACHNIAALVAAEVAAGTPPGRIVLAGFSMGGAVAIRTALCEGYLDAGVTLGGVAALSGFLPGQATFRTNPAAISGEIPVFMGHGLSDPMVPVALAQLSQGLLLPPGGCTSRDGDDEDVSGDGSFGVPAGDGRRQGVARGVCTWCTGGIAGLRTG